MKILWLTNYPLPYIAQKVGLPITVNEVWLVVLSEMLIQRGDKIVFCAAVTSVQKSIKYEENNIVFYGIYDKIPNRYNSNLKLEFEAILKIEDPDVVHIMGSEFPHSYSMLEACQKLGIQKRCVVSLQGLISKIALSYDLGIADKYKKKRPVWDIILKDSILLNKKDFSYRGNYEIKLLEEIQNVIGRTEWDFLCVNQLNPEVNYFKCNEILRNVFYSNSWNYDKCTKHSIIISQATYPVKGFHILLRAVAMLVQNYPDLKIFVPSMVVYPRAMKRWRFLNSDYANFIVTLIKKYNLEKHIEFLGSLSAEDMCQAYLKSNVFVCPSTIENSSNSLGEAMMLGMPVVASYVGGLSSMMTHRKEGFFFSLEEEYMLAAYIDLLFKDVDKAVMLGAQGRKRAMTIFNKKQNLYDVINCYHTLMGS